MSKLDELVSLVKEVVTVKPNNNSTVKLTWSRELEQECRQFFSPHWSVWHSNVNIIHRPSFDVMSCRPILLASMALIGKSSLNLGSTTTLTVHVLVAYVSPDPVDNEDAKIWFSCVEEMVFTDDDICSDTEPNSPADDRSPAPNVLASLPKLKALQASYIVCLYQNWEGSDASKRRIRRHRFSTVVSVRLPFPYQLLRILSLNPT